MLSGASIRRWVRLADGRRFCSSRRSICNPLLIEIHNWDASIEEETLAAPDWQPV